MDPWCPEWVCSLIVSFPTVFRAAKQRVSEILGSICFVSDLLLPVLSQLQNRAKLTAKN